ncbi:alkaline phosphatase [Phaffia rhodozyma]|uniref:Alkaline phosphatase n=1 Tax=Phaffia rhodozyma TaxID=264483 RepID=A0A0F7SUF9_PHARH|nr:alkaline phosphatase [Phaffia rhodozyma]
MSSQHLLNARSEDGDEEDTIGELNSDRSRRNNAGFKTWLRSLPTWLMALPISIMFVGVYLASTHQPNRTNFILMISDGFGPASETFAREFYKHTHGLDWKDDFKFPLDEILVGSSRTRSSNSFVTDSAAGATAFSCAMKSYNGAISVEPEGRHKPCGTVLEAAKQRGYKTGLVVTSRLTHATPACFYAHVVDRDMESEIAEFLVGDGPLGHVVDLALGGGLCFFQPNETSSSCRTDNMDMLESARKKGINVILSEKELLDSSRRNAKALPLPVLGLFNRDHLNYNLDRVHLPPASSEPSLMNMTEIALRTLDEAAKNSQPSIWSRLKFWNRPDGWGLGFFLMVEGSRIDMAGHSNDPGAHAEEIFEYQRTVAVVRKWIKDHPSCNTQLISVSDHETGGLSLARQLSPYHYPVYNWYPQALKNVTHSTAALGQLILAHSKLHQGEIQEDWLKEEIFKQGLGIMDATHDEVTGLGESMGIVGGEWWVDVFLANMSSYRAQLGWATHGHSGVDVNLYMEPFSTDFHGSKENYEIGARIASHLGLSLDPITVQLNEHVDDWFFWNTTSKIPKGGQQRRQLVGHESCGGHN